MTKMYYWMEILGTPHFVGLGEDLLVHTVAEKPSVFTASSWVRPIIECHTPVNRSPRFYLKNYGFVIDTRFGTPSFEAGVFVDPDEFKERLNNLLAWFAPVRAEIKRLEEFWVANMRYRRLVYSECFDQIDTSGLTSKEKDALKTHYLPNRFGQDATEWGYKTSPPSGVVMKNLEKKGYVTPHSVVVDSPWYEKQVLPQIVKFGEKAGWKHVR